jgi:hypothetical protein
MLLIINLYVIYVIKLNSTTYEKIFFLLMRVIEY